MHVPVHADRALADLIVIDRLMEANRVEVQSDPRREQSVFSP